MVEFLVRILYALTYLYYLYKAFDALISFLPQNIRMSL